VKLLKNCVKPLNERDQDDYSLECGFCMIEHDVTLQPDSSLLAKAEVGNSDLAPSDFYLFRPFKNFLLRKRFEDQNALQRTIVQYLKSLGKEHYREGMFKLEKRWDKCLHANGDYMEK
jgi:hypothetical protein